MTITEQLEAKVAELATASESLATAQADLAAATAENVTLKESLATAQADVAKAANDLATAQADLEAANTAKGSLETELATAKDELATAKAQLANPAYHHAKAGSNIAVAEGGGEGGEAMTYEQAIAAYNKIDDPRARAEFRKDHAAELRLR